MRDKECGTAALWVISEEGIEAGVGVKGIDGFYSLVVVHALYFEEYVR